MAITARTTFQAAPVQQITSDNYLDIQTNGWAQQYLPDLMEKEAEVYGKRTISGFLGQVGAEEAMSADQVIWSEQGRLHLSYRCAINTANVSTIDITDDIDNVNVTTTHGIRVGDLVLLSGGGQTVTARVSVAAAANATITVQPYANQHLDDLGFVDGDDDCRILVFGSEYAKGSAEANGTLTPAFTQYNNKPIILRDEFEVNGSDAAQIGWVEVATEDGASGYLWYLKAESETRLRFEDYMEMAMVEAEKKAGTSTVAVDGSEGLFAAIKDRGQVMDGFSGAGLGSGALADFDKVLKQLDKEGSIEENMLFLNRELALDIDDMLASVNGSTQGAAGTGASYGLFNNESDMALNLGFSGFRRGSYDFYKSDWKYLNDASTRGVLGMTALAPGNTVEGVLVPAGTSTVYDQVLGQNIRRPFLHVRYRASETEDRRMKSWITGSVGGAYTSSLDAMKVNFLSERCLCVQAANNFVLFQS